MQSAYSDNDATTAAAALMTSEEITRLFARWRDAHVRRDSVALAAVYAEDCVLESPAAGRLIGRAAIERTERDWFTTFPDAVVEFGEFVAHASRATTAPGTEAVWSGHLPTRPHAACE